MGWFEAEGAVSDVFGGTLLYIAPEGFSLAFSHKSDVWSAGVILYNLITGDYPFIETWPLPPGKDMEWWQHGVRNAIMNQSHRPHTELSTGVSRECVDLMSMMFEKDPSKRPDAAQCLEHPWFQKYSRQPPALSVGVTQCLDAFAGQPELKKAVFLLIAHQCSVSALEELRAIFTHFDTQNRGTLSASSIREVLALSGMSVLRAARILHALDRDDSGAVSWTEFIAAALCVIVCGNKPLVKAAFAVLDQNNDDKVSHQDVVDVFAKRHNAEVWAKLLPAEFEQVTHSTRSNQIFTKAQFEQYMGDHMKVIAGDVVSAVR